MQRIWEARHFWPRFVVLALVFTITAFVIWRVRSVLWLFLLALMVTYLLKPWVDRLSQLKLTGRKATLTRLSSAIVVMLAALIVFGLIILALSKPIRVELAGMMEKFAVFQESDLPALQAEWQGHWDYYRRYVPAPIANGIERWFQEAQVDTEKLGQLATAWLGRFTQRVLQALELIVELLLLPMLVFYLLSEPTRVQEAFLFFVPPPKRAFALRVGRDVGFIVEKYIQGQVTLGVIAFLIVALGLWGIDQFSSYDMPFWLTLGIWAGLTRLIPVVGPLFGSLPIVLIAVFQNFGLGVGLSIALTALHVIESKYLMPMVIGYQLRMHPVLIVLSLLVGLQLLGVVGMFMGPPTLAVARLLIEYYREGKQAEAAQPKPAPAA